MINQQEMEDREIIFDFLTGVKTMTNTKNIIFCFPPRKKGILWFKSFDKNDGVYI